MINIILVGPPCSGKGTHSTIIAKNYGFEHISTGEMFRNEIESQTPIGIIAKKLIDNGFYVPDSITLKMLYYRIKSSGNNKGFLFDGVPRTLPQAELIDRFISKKPEKIDIVFYLHAPEKELISRMQRRSSDGSRTDDNIEIFNKRIIEYEKHTHILTDYYSSKGILKSINTDDTIENVSKKILAIIENVVLEKNE